MRINQASSTATFIARCLLVAAHDDQRQQFVPAGSVELLERILAAAGSTRFSALARRAAWRWLFFRGERLAWAIACSRLERFLTGTALRLQSMIGPTELRRSFVAPAGLIDAPLIEGECLACARSLS